MNTRLSPMDAAVLVLTGIALVIAGGTLLFHLLPLVAQGGWQVSELLWGEIRR